MKRAVYKRLTTAPGESLAETPWNEYPRPQAERSEWLCLNGKWRFSAGSGEKCVITVPFCPESLLSGYSGAIEYGDVMRYEREFAVPDGWLGKRILLHFGAVSRHCEVRINGKRVAEHNNAYLPFSADITDALTGGENTIAVDASNDLSPRYPYGKQRKDRGGMWYTPVSGIWQTVWLEPVPEKHIERLIIKTDGSGADITAVGADGGVILCEGKTYPMKNGFARVEPEEPELWSPETPRLYRFTVKTDNDEVKSYFALRTLSTASFGGILRLCLNGKPYFFHGLLDQGYFSDGLYTPASPDLYINDISTVKSLGFNTLRKHIKIEPERFYYECDRLGMIVFQDMVNNGKYRFWHDTVLPTVLKKHTDCRKNNRDEETRAEFITSMEKTAELLSGHPSVCGWTIFNEGWGQFDADAAYEKLKSIDKSRFVDATSGWFHGSKSDVDSLHIYFGRLHLGKEKEKPQVLSEFGGYVYKLKEHSFNLKKTYGYKIFKTREKFADSLRSVYIEEIIPLAEKGLCASVYTQVSDVEDETNGILTFDRKVCKITPSELSGIAEELQRAVSG
ncbi:MAG: glycoside hydrolase family 2 [Clostridia bacterium]|nr:glycoside hydrolase family 2 [Clostridia bacterium]